MIDEVGDDTLFEPLSPDAVGYSDQDDLQVHFCCYSSQLLNKYLKIDVIINNIQDFYNELMYCLTVIFLCVIKVITCIPSLIYQDADRDYESISSGDELPNMDEIDPELQVCIHRFY